MPSPTTSKWPLPKSEDEFEDMVLDAVRVRWRDPDARRNGRRGQRQDGVDVFGSAQDATDARQVAQCKNTLAPTLAKLQADLVRTAGFKSPIKKFYFAVAAPRDARLEEDVRMLSAQRVLQKQFPVEILFYEDICHDLGSDEALVARHFPGWPSAASESDRAKSWIGVVNPAADNVRWVLKNLVSRRLWTWRHYSCALQYIRPLAEVLGEGANPVLDDLRHARQDEAMLIEDWDDAVMRLENAAGAEAAWLIADNNFCSNVTSVTSEYLSTVPVYDQQPWGACKPETLPALIAQHIVNNVGELSDDRSAKLWNAYGDRLRRPAEESPTWAQRHAETDARGKDLEQVGQRLVQGLEALRRYLCKKHGVAAASAEMVVKIDERF